MTINLEKELLSQNKKLVVPEELLLIREYEKQTALADSDVLSRVGLNEAIREGRKIKDRVNFLKSQTTKYDQQRVFHISQIESICKKYHLRFLQTFRYKGTIDVDLPTKISTFEIAHGLTCDSYNTYIMAPQESFTLEERPKDPLMFYKINDQYFYLIHKWGNDLSVSRRILPILSSPWLFWAALVLFLPTVTYCTWGISKSLSEILLVFSGVAAVIVSVIQFIRWHVEDRPFSFIKRNKWDSEYTW